MVEVCVTEDKRIKIDKNIVDRVVDTMQDANHERVNEHTDKKICKQTRKSIIKLYNALPAEGRKAVDKASKDIEDERNAQAYKTERQLLMAFACMTLTGFGLVHYLGAAHNYVGMLTVTFLLLASIMGLMAIGVAKFDGARPF